jgi:hypothetical protein
VTSASSQATVWATAYSLLPSEARSPGGRAPPTFWHTFRQARFVFRTPTAAGRRLFVLSATGLVLLDAEGRERQRISAPGPEFVAAAVSARGRLAYVRRRPSGSSEVVLGSGRRVFSGTGEFAGLAWSPDGRWLLTGWPTANQWVFVRVAGPRRIVAAADIARQFGGGAFPRVAGWCC